MESSICISPFKMKFEREYPPINRLKRRLCPKYLSVIITLVRLIVQIITIIVVIIDIVRVLKYGNIDIIMPINVQVVNPKKGDAYLTLVFLVG